MPAHNGLDRAGDGAAPICIVWHVHGHEERAEIRKAESERTVAMRVVRDHLRGVRGVVNQPRGFSSCDPLPRFSGSPLISLVVPSLQFEEVTVRRSTDNNPHPPVVSHPLAVE